MTQADHRNPQLVATTVRWDSVTYDWVRNEARSAGVTMAQFVREAAMIRAALRAAQRDAPGLPVDFGRLAEEVERRSGAGG